jgi:surface antigen
VNHQLQDALSTSPCAKWAISLTVRMGHGATRWSGAILSAAVLVGMLLVIPAAAAGGSPSGSLSLNPVNARASRSLPVRLSASEIEASGDVGIRIAAHTAPRARCQLQVRSKKARARFPALRATRKGTGVWSWLVADRAPTGEWKMHVRCKLGSRSGATTYKAFIYTENATSRRGAIIGHSTTRIERGHPATRPRIPNKRRRSALRSQAVASANTYPAGQCTWYAKQRRPDIGNYWGNAGGWIASARRAGFPTGSTPQVGAIAVWPPGVNGASGDGHVAYVERVVAPTVIEVSEFNWKPYRYGYRPTGTAGLSFIYRRGESGAPPPPPFKTSLDAQFPMDGLNQVYVVAGEPGVSVGYNVRFNHAFSVPDFVLRPDTPAIINRFSSVKGDFPGARSPNDDHVGYFRTGVSAPADTKSGSYFMRWNAIRKSTGQFGGLQPSLILVVLPPKSKGPGPCPPPAPGGPFSLATDPSYTASLDAQFPIDSQGRMFVSRGQSIAFGFNIRFNQAFNVGNFLLRTDTPGTINYFSRVKGDWPGAFAPNDDHVGHFRTALDVPACTPPGQYFLRWNVINMATGRWGGLQPSFVLVVQ